MSLTPVESTEYTQRYSKRAPQILQIKEENEDTDLEEAVTPVNQKLWYPEQQEMEAAELSDGCECDGETKQNINNNEGCITCSNAQILKVENEKPSSAAAPSTGWTHGPYTQQLRELLPEGQDALTKIAGENLDQLRLQNLKLEDKRDSLLSKLAAKIPTASSQMRMHYLFANKVCYDKLFQEARDEQTVSQGLKWEIEKYNSVVDISKKLDELRTKQMETEKVIEKQQHYVNQIGYPVEGKTAELSKDLTVLKNRYIKAQRNLSTTPGEETNTGSPQMPPVN